MGYGAGLTLYFRLTINAHDHLALTIKGENPFSFLNKKIRVHPKD